MLKYFQTTTLILIWCFGLTLAWAFFCYWRTSRRPKAVTPMSRRALLPALVLGPLALVLAFRIAGINLLFPLHFFASWEELAVAALGPALVLVLASGMLGNLARGIRREYQHWQRKTFVTVSLAVGKSVPASLRRLVLVKALASAWSQGLPWLFGELIVVEAVFNAPGLGLDAWHLAKVRDLAGLSEALLWLAAMYGACVTVTAQVNRWIGRKLATYA